MRRNLLLLLALALAVPGRGQDMERFLSDLVTKRNESEAGKAKTLDPKRIINASNSFMKEREPEMTAEEYAIYEQVTTMLATNPDFALKLLQNVMTDKNAVSPAFELILGNTHYAAGRVDEAEKYYKSAVDHFPSFIRAWNNLGVLYYTAGRFAEAIPCFSKAITLGDRNAATVGLLGCCLEREGETIAAENAFLQALAGEPLNTDWQDGLLRVYVATRQFGPAEVVARGLIKRHPTETRYWLTLANVLLSAHRKGEALVLLEAARATGVAGNDELLLLGDLYVERNLFPEAIALYRQVHAKGGPEGEGRLLRYARALLGAGRLAEAQQALDPIVGKVTPAGRADLALLRADVFAAKKEWAQARRELEALLALDPLSGNALLRVGRTYLGEEDYFHAQLAFESAARVPDVVYPASLELANLELKNRHYPQVVTYLQRALAIEKTDAVAELLHQVEALLAPGK